VPVLPKRVVQIKLLVLLLKLETIWGNGWRWKNRYQSSLTMIVSFPQPLKELSQGFVDMDRFNFDPVAIKSRSNGDAYCLAAL